MDIRIFLKKSINNLHRSITLLSLFFYFLAITFLSAQNYYLYVASESDDTVSLLKFDGISIKEIKRINVGFYPTEIEGVAVPVSSGLHHPLKAYESELAVVTSAPLVLVPTKSLVA